MAKDSSQEQKRKMLHQVPRSPSVLTVTTSFSSLAAVGKGVQRHFVGGSNPQNGLQSYLQSEVLGVGCLKTVRYDWRCVWNAALAWDDVDIDRPTDLSSHIWAETTHRHR